MTQTLSLLALLPQLLLTSALPWYFWERPKQIVRSYFSYAGALTAIISIPFLLKTLFSPWKSIKDEYPSNGMRMGEIAQVFTLNMTTRVIGFMFRIVALTFAVTLQLALLVGFLAYLVLWLTYPGLLVALVTLNFQLPLNEFNLR